MRHVYLILIAGFTVAYAGTTYSVNDLVTMTIKSHPSIKMQEQVIRGANAQVQGAMWNYFPTPSISVNQGVNKDKLWGGTAAIEQPLWTGGKISSTYDMAVANKHNSEYGLEDNGYILVETLLNTLKTYLKAKGDLEALAEGQMQLGILEGMVSRRVAAGVSSKSDMELLKARLYQMQTDINYAKTRRDSSLAQIELLTNHKFNGGLEIDQRVPFSFDSLDKIIKSMINTHPSLKKFDAELELAEAEKSKAKSVFWPNISIKAERGVGSSSLYYDDPMDETLVYLSVQASPGAGLSAFSGVETAEAKIMQVRQEKLSKQQDLINKVMYAYNDYTSSANRVESQSGSIGSSQKVFASYTRLFLAGKRQWLDLVNASRELTQNQMAFEDTRSTLVVSAYQLALLGGKDGLLDMLGNNKLAKLKKPAKPIEPARPSIPADKNQKVTFDTIFSRKDENLSKTAIKTGTQNKSNANNVQTLAATRKEKVEPKEKNETKGWSFASLFSKKPETKAAIAAKAPVVKKEEVKTAAAPKAKTTTTAPKTVIAKKAETKDKNVTSGWSFASLFSKKPETKAAVAAKAPVAKKEEKPKVAVAEAKKAEVKAVAAKAAERPKVAAATPKVEAKEKNETKGWGFASLFSKKPETKAVAKAPVVKKEEKPKVAVAEANKVEVKAVAAKAAEKPKVTAATPKVEVKEKNETKGWGFASLFSKKPETKAAVAAKAPVVKKEEKPKVVVAEAKKAEVKAVAAKAAEKPKVAAVTPKVEAKEKNETKGWGFASLFSKKPETKAAVAAKAPVAKKEEKPKVAVAEAKKAEVKAVAAKAAERPKVAAATPKVEAKEKNETKGWGFASLFSKKPETKAVAKAPVVKKEEKPKVAVAEAKKAEVKAVAAKAAEKPKVAAVAKKPKKIVIENMVVAGKSKAITQMPEPQQPIGVIVKATKPIPGKEQYYVQFNAKINENMKNELKKQNLEIMENGDHSLIGCYARATDALKVAREVKNIICDEAYIVRQ
ncbi:MAG: TolC family protein [Sulfurovaceae bacterium]